MKTKIVARHFYEFHRTRNVARPGQPPKNVDGIEIGPLIAREDALKMVKAGGDVYTPRKKDAYRLARDAHGAAPGVDEIHKPEDYSPTGRKDVYFRHFHPGAVHHSEGGGAVYFGHRGEGLNTSGEPTEDNA
jgi:hypothetical protein